MPNSDKVRIKVENVSKKFCRSLKRSMLYGIAFVGCGEGRTASFATDAHRYRSAHPTHSETQMKDTVINIISATQTGDYRIRLIFDDNTRQEIDFKSFLAHSHHPDIRAYLEPSRFADFRVEYGELIWGDYELCFPVIDLYRNMIEHYPPAATTAT